MMRGGSSAAQTGEVFLVGAGPGALDLLTLRAINVLRRADVVIYDRLVGPDILDLVPAAAERIFVGKMRARHIMPQAEINRLMVEHAQAGACVVRLKGGDPLVFGRGGEELAALAAAGIGVEIVPGVTAALGCAASAGIPLTHRDLAHTLILATGHTKDGAVDLDWPALARPGRTLVIYMGVKGLADVCGRLIEHGLAADTPAALVENGTYPHQQVTRGSLLTLPGLVAAAPDAGPALIVVGQVVGLPRPPGLGTSCALPLAVDPGDD